MYKNYQNSDTFTALDANSVMRQGLVPIASLTERNRLVTHKGMTIYRTDLNREERFDGSNWISSESGLVQIYPTSVTGTMQLQADGSVGGTNVPNGRCNIDGIFTPRYSRYKIITTLSGKSTINATLDAIIRTGAGVDNGQSDYFLQQSTWNNGNALVYSSGSNSLRTIFDDAGSLQLFTTEVSIGSNYALLNSSFVGRGGTISNGQKTASIEGLGSRATGLGIDLGQTVAAPNMRFYAYT